MKGRAGLWWTAVVCAATVPVAASVCAWHRSHWPGVGGASWWRTVVLPVSARAWAMLAVLLLAGWAASAGPRRPDRIRSIGLGAWAGAQGALLAILLSIPGWIWLARLTVDATADVAFTGFIAALPAFAAAVFSGLSGATLGPVAGASLGLSSGAGLLWATWGTLA